MSNGLTIGNLKYDKYTPILSLQKFGTMALGTVNEGNGVSICKFGDRGNGQCTGNLCLENDNYGTDPQDSTKGWIVCEYKYNFNNYRIDDTSDFYSWIRDIYNNIKPINQTLARRILDSNIIYSTICDFYNQLYFKGPYPVDVARVSLFSRIDLRKLTDFKNTIINKNCAVVFKSLYDNEFPSELKLALNNLLLYPRAFVENGKFYLYFNLNYEMYKEFLQKSLSPGEQMSYITNLLNKFFRDEMGELFDVLNNTTITAGNATYKNLVSGEITVINLKDTDTVPLYALKKLQYSTFDKPDSYKDWFFGIVDMRIEIKDWSPMVALYFIIYNSDFFKNNDTICDEIKNRGGGFSVSLQKQLPFTLPKINYDLRTDKLEQIDALCKIDYKRPGFMDFDSFNSNFILKDNSECGCLTSTISGVTKTQYKDIAAMCFDKSCMSTDIKNKYNINPENCQGFCEGMYKLINQESNRSRNLETIDMDAYTRICGSDYKPPYAREEYNTDMLKSGAVITILTCLMMICFCISKKYKTGTIILIIFVSLSICLAIFFFLSKDLSGKGYCPGGGGQGPFVCKSSITGIPLPDRYCEKEKQACECKQSSDCGSNCVCASTQCVPRIGIRKEITIVKNKFDVIGITTTCIATVLVLLSFLFLKIHFSLSAIPIIPILLVGISVLGFYIIEKTEITKPEGQCCSPVCDGVNCGGDNGCGGICGCPDGAQCESDGICSSFKQSIPSPSINNDIIPSEQLTVCSKCDNIYCPCPIELTCINGKCENYKKYNNTIIRGKVMYNADDGMRGTLNECLSLCSNDRRCGGISRTEGIPDDVNAGCGVYFTPGTWDDGTTWHTDNVNGIDTYVKNTNNNNYKSIRGKDITGNDLNRYSIRRSGNAGPSSYDGKYKVTFDVDNAAICKHICNLQDECVGFVHIENDKTCVYKTKAGCENTDDNQDMSCLGTNSANQDWNVYYKTDKTEWIEKPGTDIRGYDLKWYYNNDNSTTFETNTVTMNGSVSDCKNFCLADSQCGGFSRNDNTQTCYFKKIGISTDKAGEAAQKVYAKRVDDPLSKFTKIPDTYIPNFNVINMLSFDSYKLADSVNEKLNDNDKDSSINMSNLANKEEECTRQCLNADGCMAATLTSDGICRLKWNWTEQRRIPQPGTTLFIRKN